ncbi:hypothetical protein FRB99_005012 [Tulasnella sp. 403]|nr:hypothetical protein FRB99_005012 [Tulasnella sp. 403]
MASLPAYFDLSPNRFPWTPDLCQHIEERRHQLQGDLFIDSLLRIAGVDAHALYPPHDTNTFHALYDAIQNCSFDDVKKNCLLYYLLKTWQNESAEDFAHLKAIPLQFVILSDGYYHLDAGEIEEAVTSICDPRVTPDFTSKILQTIAAVPDAKQRSRLVLRYVKIGKPPLSELEDIEQYLRALCESSVTEAWLYQRTFPEDAGHNATRTRLLDIILEHSLCPRPRAAALKALVAFPFTAFEHNHITSYALSPPDQLSEQSLAILHDLINVRLIHQGHYSEAIRLDKQFSYSPYNTGAGIVSKGIEARRQNTRDILSVLPEVQRKLLDVRLDQEEVHKNRRPLNSSGSGAMFAIPTPSSSVGDLSMSWEQVDRSQVGASSSMLRSSQLPKLTRNQTGSMAPVSASPAFRQSSPQTAVLQAFAQSSVLEGSPIPHSRFGSGHGAGPSTPSMLKASKRKPIKAPFGTLPLSASSSRSQNASLGKMTPLSVQLRNARSSASSASLSSAATPQRNQPDAQNVSLSKTVRPDYSGNPFYRPERSTGIGESAMFSPLRLKRTFDQVANSASSSIVDDAVQHNEGDLSLSDLQPTKRADITDSSDDDDVVLNASRSVRMLRPAPSLGPAVGPGKERVEEVPEEDEDGPASSVALSSQSSLLPGAFPTDEEAEEPARTATRSRGKAGSRQSSTAQSKTSSRTTGKKASASAKAMKSSSRTTKGSPVKPSEGDAESSTALPVRRSSRLSVAPTGSPERKKLRPSLEPEPVKKGRTTAKKAASSKVSSRRPRGIPEEE